MENTVNNWLKDSLSFRLTSKAAAVWKASLVHTMLVHIASIARASKTSQAFSRFTDRPFKPEQALSYRLLQGLDDLLAPFRARAASVIENSAIFRGMKDSVAFRLILSRLIPAAAFFVFFDELGRDLFGSSSLFAYWDEVYLLLGILYVFAAWLMNGRKRQIKATPLDMPVMLFVSATFFLFMVNSPDRAIGFEGMRAAAQFVLWFFVFRGYIDSEGKAAELIRCMVWCGGILGFHGITQYLMGVKTPSGWTDYAEGASTGRAFSIVGSPNILGSILALTIPLGISLVLQKGLKPGRRAIYAALLAGMTLCMILTLSRGAWAGLVAGLIVFCLFRNAGWLFGLGAAGCAAFLLPRVSNRILYMLSPQYIESSLTGGRLLRYRIGWDMFRNNLLKGVGLGRFGGAVAMNHKDVFPNTFYMDNYWLKSAVEMGLIGLIALSALVLFTVVWSIRAVNRIWDDNRKLLAIGGFSGMTGILIHNFFENVFEVPYMVIYFWMVAAVVMYLGFGYPKRTER